MIRTGWWTMHYLCNEAKLSYWSQHSARDLHGPELQGSYLHGPELHGPKTSCTDLRRAARIWTARARGDPHGPETSCTDLNCTGQRRPARTWGDLHGPEATCTGQRRPARTWGELHRPELHGPEATCTGQRRPARTSELHGPEATCRGRPSSSLLRLLVSWPSQQSEWEEEEKIINLHNDITQSQFFKSRLNACEWIPIQHNGPSYQFSPNSCARLDEFLFLFASLKMFWFNRCQHCLSNKASQRWNLFFLF